MGDAPPTITIDNSSEFLRRVRLPDQVNPKKNIVHWRAFNDRDERLSFTLRCGELMNLAGVDEYHAYICERFQIHLAAILRFTHPALAKHLEPPLVPAHDPVPEAEDPKYGFLHCSTPCPIDKDHMKRMAKLVNDGEFASILKNYPVPPAQN